MKLSPVLFNWIHDFLKDRTFQVYSNGFLSTSKTITCGVPQGSCLSPTIFILYFSEIVKHISKNIKTALFADDLCVWFSTKSKKDLNNQLQNALYKIVEFCKTWGFTINSSKTFYTVFTTAGKRINYSDKYKLNLNITNQQIPLEPNPTFLGIKLDPKICFKPHLQEIEKKLVSKTNLIKRIKNFKWSNSTSINLTLYKSLIRSLFDYCFIIINSGTEKIKTSLQKIQNKILKIIKFFPIKTSIRTIHKVLKLETIEERANQLFIKFLTAKANQDLIAHEILEFNNSQLGTQSRFITPLHKYTNYKLTDE